MVLQDGAPGHKPLAVREKLGKVFDSYVVVLQLETEWLSRIPDLTPRNVYGVARNLEHSPHHQPRLQRILSL